MKLRPSKRKAQGCSDGRPRHRLFQKFSQSIARATGHSLALGFALRLLAAWAVAGPLFQFNDTWQLVINTLITIQSTQNRDSEAVQLKLDELIRANEASELKLDQIKSGYGLLAKDARQSLRSARPDLGVRVASLMSFPSGEQNNNPPRRRVEAQLKEML